MARTKSEHEAIVKQLLDAKVVDFEALGKLVSLLGPVLAKAQGDPELCFGSMLHFGGFVHMYELSMPADRLEQLDGLAKAVGKRSR